MWERLPDRRKLPVFPTELFWLGLMILVVLLLCGCCRTDGPLIFVDGGVPAADSGVPEATDAGLDCVPFSVRSCYEGAQNTLDVGICHAGMSECSASGKWGVCDGQQLPRPEVCNCLDDDCNGKVDDIPDTQMCYDGPSGTDGVGLCHPGVAACSLDRSIDCAIYCKGEQTPGPSECDGLDHACTGQPEVTQDAVEVVFLVDDTTDGCEDGLGAQGYADALGAASAFAAQYPQANFSWALVLLPGCGNAPAQERIVQPPVGAGAFQVATAAQASCLACPSGEPFYSYDVLWNQILGLTVGWSTGTRKVVVLFTGDEGESMSGHDAQTIGYALADGGVELVTFAPDIYLNDYGSFSTAFSVAGQNQMLQDLDQALQFPCDGG